MKKISKNALVIMIIAAIAIVGLIGVYFIGKTNYEDKFLPGTTINGFDCAGETVDEVKDDLQTEVESYTLTIEERDGKTETINGKDLGLIYKDNGEVEKLLDKQDSSLWFMHMSGNNYSVSTAFSFDEKNLRTLVNKMECFKPENIIAPQDAVISKQDDEYVILPEVEGNELDKSEVYKEIEAAVKDSKKSIDLEELGLYKEPARRSTDEALNSEIAAIDQMMKAVLTYDFVDSQWVCDKSVIADWFSADENGDYSLDRGKVYEWVSNMAYETDTFGLKHPFMTSYGVEITLEGGGDYGWCIDKDATTDALCQYIQAGQNAVVQPEYLYTAMDRSTHDIGNTYVEVCVTTQTLWCYYNGELITTTPIISGNESKGYNTPSGSVWAIDGKKPDWQFTNFPTAHSDFWMPFNDECGLHDASWQAAESYNTETYKTAGSHGCINTPYESMEKIFNYMEIGYPVVVYYSLDQIVGPGPTEELMAGG